MELKASNEWLLLEAEKRELDRERQEFLHQMEFERKKLDQERRLFQMKWKILEEELSKFSVERDRFEQQKSFYNRVRDYESRNSDTHGEVISGEMFFTGVHTELGLKRRYKELIKIYHPDNLDGDNETIQEINREYDDLKKKFG